MAATDTKTKLFNLIREFNSEKSQGERRVICLKKRIEELELEIEVENLEIEEAKRLKEETDQELKELNLQLALDDSAVQTLESRNSLIQNEISGVESEVEACKDELGDLRDEFVKQMLQLNAEIRAFQQTWASYTQRDNSVGAAADGSLCKKEDRGVTLEALKDMLTDIISKKDKVEKDYLDEENNGKQVLLELNHLERKVTLLDTFVNVTKALQDSTKQISDLEQACSSLGVELQKMCTCPGCGVENAEVLRGILQGI